MSGKEQFMKLPREVLESDAFGSLGINGFRVLRFLMIEHMRRGGRQNGLLKAPHRHLVAFGIPKDCVTTGIAEVETSRLIGAQRHGLRVATDYTLTWLPLHDGSPASNEWRRYLPPAKAPARRSRNLPPKVGAGLPPKVGADRRNLPPKVGAEPSENLPPKVGALYRSSYQGEGSPKEEGYGSNGAAASGAEPEAPPGAPAGKANGEEVAEPDLDGSPVARADFSLGKRNGAADSPICRWPLGAGCLRPATPGSRFCDVHGAR